MPRIWNESDGDWQPTVNEVRHRLELIEQRDGAVSSEKFDACLRIGLRMAQRDGMNAAIQAIEVTAEEHPACAEVLRRLARELRGY